MPLHTTASYLLYEARKLLPENPDFCSLCNFNWEASDHFLRWLRERAEDNPFIHTDVLDALLAMTRVERLPLMNTFRQALGIDRVVTLESNSKEGAIPVDFNLHLQRDFGFTEQFDMVENSGVTEHVFDQRAIFENIHNLCKVGGIMSHRIPMYGALNITLYGVAPRFLHDLAVANRYEICGLWICNRWGDVVPVLDEALPQFRPDIYRAALPRVPGFSRGLSHPGLMEGEILEDRFIPDNLRIPESITLADFMAKSTLIQPGNVLSGLLTALALRAERFRSGNGGEFYTGALLRKVHDEPFRVPYQGNNLKDIEGQEMKDRYRHQFSALGT